MQEQGLIELCEYILKEFYESTLNNNGIFKAITLESSDKDVQEALSILVFNDYLIVEKDCNFTLTTLGIGAVMYGFNNAEKIFNAL